MGEGVRDGKCSPGGYTLRRALTSSVAKAKKIRVRKKTLIMLVSKDAIATEA